MPSSTLYSYLQIRDVRGARKVNLKEPRYLVGGSSDCDIRLSAPTADECKALFVRVESGYEVRDIDLKISGGREPLDYYTLRDGDRIVFAPLALVIYIRSYESPDPDGGVPARLPPPPTMFPPVEAVASKRFRASLQA